MNHNIDLENQSIHSLLNLHLSFDVFLAVLVLRSMPLISYLRINFMDRN
jgi:hypothetical protein